MPVRELTGHKVNPANDKLTIKVMDEPVSMYGSNHHYQISGYSPMSNPATANTVTSPEYFTDLIFQNGPIAKVGVNGITNEALLAIVVDRLQGFQRGEFACRENAVAITKLEEAQMWLNKRTVERMQRGVEGTHQK